MRIEKLEREYDIRVDVVHFPLHPETPREGRSLRELFGDERGERLRAGQERMKALAAAEGLPWGERTMTYNSRLAQEMGAWAESVGKGTAFDAAIFRAYFARGANIASPEVLIETAVSVGLDADEARRVLDERTFRDAVTEDWARSMRTNIGAVPTFAAGERVVSGAEPYETLEQLVIDAGARRRAK